MTDYIVTVKLPRRADHDPRNKKTGPCPAAPECRPGTAVQFPTCTDCTGEHHSYLVRDTTPAAIGEIAAARQIHITRIEEVPQAGMEWNLS